MLHHLFSTPLIVLTLLSTFWCQQGSAEGLNPLSTVGLLPTSSFLTAIRQTTGIQPAEASSLPTLPSAPTPGPSSSPLDLFSTSLPPSVNDKTKAKEVVVAEKSPTTIQEVALLPRSGIRPRPAGIFAQCTMWWTFYFWTVHIELIKEWHVPDDLIEQNLRAELKNHCGSAMTGEHYFPIEDDGRGASFRAFIPLFIHDHCVEEAIVAAGGPKLYCSSRRPKPEWKNPASPWIPVRDGPIGTVVNNIPTTSSPTVSQTAAVSPS